MNEDVVKKICQDVSVPKMIKVRQHFVEDNISPLLPLPVAVGALPISILLLKRSSIM